MRNFLRNLSSNDRTEISDRYLAYVLTFVAGAANAGGFLAVQQYTSHMSGIVSAMADNLVLGKIELVLAGFVAFTAFVFGAACSAILVNWARRHKLLSQYALPLMLEALLLLLFAISGHRIQTNLTVYIPATVFHLCFIMGLQNATVSKLSQSRIRTTHITGLVTDFGVELGKSVYWNRLKSPDGFPVVRANKQKFTMLLNLILLFFVGGVIGAFIFSSFGFIAAIALAAILATIAIFPICDELKLHLNRRN